MKVNLAAREVGAPSHIPKPKMEWTTENQKRNNLDNVAKGLVFMVVNDTIFSKIKGWKTTEDILDSLMQSGECDMQ